MEEPLAAEYPSSTRETPSAAGDASEQEGWMDYSPPPALSKLPTGAAETIVVVVQSALENIREQVEAEKERAKQRRDAPEQAAEADSPDQEERGGAVEGKGKGRADDEQHEDRTTASGSSQPTLWPLPEPRKHRRRSRFGISRILRHVVDKVESREGNDASQEREDAHRPTAFTQFVYKHIKASSAEPEGPV
jgi:hypothetical protein